MTKTKTATPQFRSSLTYTPDEVKSVLEAKIQEEEAIAQRSATAATLQASAWLLAIQTVCLTHATSTTESKFMCPPHPPLRR